MVSLIKQHGLYYVQFFNSKRRPKQKRIPLKTRTKQTALTLKPKLENVVATGSFAPWLNERKIELVTTITKKFISS
jgi:hypothetical protein